MEDPPQITPPIKYSRHPSQSRLMDMTLPPTHPNGVGLSSRINWREKIIQFYEVWNPSKVSQVDNILDTHRGREEDVFNAIVEKYKGSTAPPGSGTTPPVVTPMKGQQPQKVRRIRDPVTGKVFRKVLSEPRTKPPVSPSQTPSKCVGIHRAVSRSPIATPSLPFQPVQTPIQTPPCDPPSQSTLRGYGSRQQQQQHQQYSANNLPPPLFSTPPIVRSRDSEECQSVAESEESSMLPRFQTPSVLESPFGVQRSTEKCRSLTKNVITNRASEQRDASLSASRSTSPLHIHRDQSNSPTISTQSSAGMNPPSVSETVITTQVSETLKTILEEQRQFFDVFSKRDRESGSTHQEIAELKKKMMADSERCARLESELGELKKLWIRQNEEKGNCGLNEPDDEGAQRDPLAGRSLSPTSPKMCDAVVGEGVCGHVGSRRSVPLTLSGVPTCNSVYVDTEPAMSVTSDLSTVDDIEVGVQQLSRQIKEAASSWNDFTDDHPDNDSSDDDLGFKFNSHDTLPDRVVLTSIS
eukprot:TRINITY_DN33885_c0_g1_i1.p1 TRINITY_DN33885_c0_g1~~TRINITY_DN33885_c0_g1_i1.p1  ORF type:complete len:525 (+),score=107.88 TRINITY_DN33885_c0_g1_i1:41-1615(+)